MNAVIVEALMQLQRITVLYYFANRITFRNYGHF